MGQSNSKAGIANGLVTRIGTAGITLGKKSTQRTATPTNRRLDPVSSVADQVYFLFIQFAPSGSSEPVILLDGGVSDGKMRASLWFHVQNALSAADRVSEQVISAIRDALAPTKQILEVGVRLTGEYDAESLDTALRGFWTTLSRTLGMPSEAARRPASVFPPHLFGSGCVLWANVTSTKILVNNTNVRNRFAQDPRMDLPSAERDTPEPGPLVPLDPLPGPPEVGGMARKSGRPVTTVRRLAADTFLNASLPKLEATLDELHKPILERFQNLLDQLAGQAAPTFGENHRVATEVMRLAERYGVALVFEKGGESHRVVVRCADDKSRGTGIFQVVALEKRKSLAALATWPRLLASTPKNESF